MTKQLNMFDRPEPRPDVSASPDPLPDTSAPVASIPLHPMKDVRRTVQHKQGRFIEVLGGVRTGREYVFVELLDGRWFRQFIDNGERRAVPMYGVITDGLSNRMFEEVAP